MFPASHVSCSYNQLEEDFPSLHEYNDYLEEVETIGDTPCTVYMFDDGAHAKPHMCSVQLV